MAHVIRDAVFPEDAPALRTLLTQYQAEVGDDLCFQNFAAELRDLPGRYAAPAGLLLCAQRADRLVGCIALQPLQSGIAEMKRLYVEPQQRRSGIARQLVLELVRRACELRYQWIWLDSLPTMASAQRLYATLGFVDVAPYTRNPSTGVRHMGLELNRSAVPCPGRV